MEDEDFGKLFRCGCMKEKDEAERARRLLRICELPPKASGMTFKTFQSRRGTAVALAACIRMAEGKSPHTFLTLAGEVDTGKTHLAVAVVNRWIERLAPARYQPAAELLDDLRRGYGPKADIDYDNQLHFFKNVDLLVLDDLGMENSTPWAQEKLELLIDYRMMHEKPLVVTTNRSMDRLPIRIASRLQRNGAVIALTCGEFRLAQ